MAIERDELQKLIALRGRVRRVVIAQIQGSSPREIGAAMLVWGSGQSGTIGGGALEYQAATDARRALKNDAANTVERHPLGPALGQCCGGVVTLLSETIDAASLRDIPQRGAFLRPVRTTCPEQSPPLNLRRRLNAARARGQPVAPIFQSGWMLEPIHSPSVPVWIWGAGHVGRALLSVLAPLPQLNITWVDTSPDRFPPETPENVQIISAANPALLMPRAPVNAHHLILTYSHALDLELCHRALDRGFASAGVIGSATKWARFRKRLGTLGHNFVQIDQISCPIGDPALGKHPQAIAVGTASALLNGIACQEPHQKEQTA